MITDKIDEVLSAQDLPNVSAVVTTDTDNIYEGAFGEAEAGGGQNIDVSTPFAIMSMTKPITSMAIMRLIEAGELTLETPAADILPAHLDQLVLASVDAEAGTYVTEPQNKPFTIRQLLTHTTGIGYAFCNETILALRPESDALTFPLCHQPDAKWTYGASTQVLGQIIESITGKTLPSALDELIFEPLDMSATTFEVQSNQAHIHVKDGQSWQPQPLGRAMQTGDGGLISTSLDYAKFVRCLLNNGAPLISNPTFQQMISNQIGDLFVREMPAANPGFTHPFPRGGNIDKWGLGFQIHQEPKPGGRHAGALSWCGLYNTYFWVDPKAGLGAVLLTQVLPLYDPACLTALDSFEQAVYED
ncbi:MAG: methyl acetate hydrolase [Candidatus Azotimanducaceae bacterium]|jgi:methyl acetate hydrolase